MNVNQARWSWLFEAIVPLSMHYEDCFVFQGRNCTCIALHREQEHIQTWNRSLMRRLPFLKRYFYKEWFRHLRFIRYLENGYKHMGEQS